LQVAYSSRPKSRIALSIGQQLNESGVLQHMLVVVKATAMRLQAAAGDTPAAAVAAAAGGDGGRGSAQGSSPTRTPAQDNRIAPSAAPCTAQRTASSAFQQPVLTADEEEELEVTAELLKTLD
jgi:hypothetical protein